MRNGQNQENRKSCSAKPIVPFFFRARNEIVSWKKESSFKIYGGGIASP